MVLIETIRQREEYLTTQAWELTESELPTKWNFILVQMTASGKNDEIEF